MTELSSDETERLAHAAILGQLAEGVIVTDAVGRITFVNQAAETIHGVARLDIEPDAYSDTYHLFNEDGQPYPTFDLPLARAVRGQIVRDERWRILRPDGTVILAIGSARPLLGYGGRQIGAVLTLRDDTARDAAERALRKLAATLTERVAERTREAEAAREVAEAASRAKTDFLAAMSHEIRTPLSGILGYTDLLLEETELSAVRRSGERIRSAGAALLTIVNDILDFAKVEAGRLELASAPFDLSSLVDEAIGIVRESAERKGLTLLVKSAGGLPASVVGDADRLRQVLLNLLNNAIKFTRSGKVTLAVRSLDRGAGVAGLRFEVEDTGIGIAAAKRHLLFERFSQIDGSNQREFSGTGLGLAICKSLVELMGGAIGCDSELDRGSVFWCEIALPVAVAIPRPADAAAPASAVGRHLLVVEDVVVNQELARAILERAGHQVQIASGALEAVAAVQTTRFDVVLMDVQMPVMDGLEATRRIRALDHPAADVPIIAMSANVLPHQVALCRDAGMQDHVGKPFKREHLLATIERWARQAPDTADLCDADLGRCDRATLEALAAPMGSAATQRLLGAFARELRARFDGEPDAAALGQNAHALVSAAGMLGFDAFAALCREAAKAKGEHETARLTTRLQAAGWKVVATIEEIAAAA